MNWWGELVGYERWVVGGWGCDVGGGVWVKLLPMSLTPSLKNLLGATLRSGSAPSVSLCSADFASVSNLLVT